MPLLSRLRNVSKYTRLLRYDNSSNSSQRYLIRASRVDFKPPRRDFHRSFKAFEKAFDRGLKVNISRNRNYGSGHVNKTRNMGIEQEQTGINATQKENDDLSLPFWLFLWSFLAILAGLIYTKLNKRNGAEYEPKSDVSHTVNDEQIARKLVNEISKKDSGKQHTFRRQRSYEIIDGEVRIHYDISMLDESIHKTKRPNIEGILRTAEVESIPIRSTSLDDLELIYPGNLPRIVEEGDEDDLENQNEEQDSVYVNEANPDAQICLDKSRETHLNAAKTKNQLNSQENTSNFEVNGEYFGAKRDDFTTNFETISNERLIPTAESTTDTNIITIGLKKDNSELSHQSGTNLYLNENVDSDELSSTSEESVIENISPTPINVSKNSTHNSNTRSNSVYKLTEVEKSEAHNFIVTRREGTKLNSSTKTCLESNSIEDETSFPFVETECLKTAELQVSVNRSQLSREVKCDTLIAQENLQIPENDLNSYKNTEVLDTSIPEKDTENDILDNEVITAFLVENFEQNEQNVKESNPKCQIIDDTCQESLHQIPDIDYLYNEPAVDLKGLDNVNFQQECLKHEHVNTELSSGDVYKSASSPVQEPCVLTCFEEGSDILVDNTGDFLFKVIGPSIEDEYLEDIAETDENICEKIDGENSKFAFDENENCHILDKELAKSWKSLPSWEAVHSIQHREVDSDSSDIDHIDDENIVLDAEVENSMDVHGSMEEKNKQSLELEPVLNGGLDLQVVINELEPKYLNIQKSSGISDERSAMKNTEKLVYDEEINEVPLLMLENKIGSRKTLFVKDAPEPVYAENYGNTESLTVRSSLSSVATARTGVDEVPLFTETQNENDKPDTSECEISDEIVIAQAVGVKEVEAEVPLPCETDTMCDDAVTFARANLVEEDILVAKIITTKEPELIIAPDIDLDKSEQNCANVLTNSEIKTVTVENHHTTLDSREQNYTPYTKQTTEDLHSDITLDDFKPISKTPTTSVTSSSVQTVTKVTHTTVHSIIKKFENAKTPDIPSQTENDNVDSNNDIHETIVENQNHEEFSENKVKMVIENGSINNNVGNDNEIVDDYQISELFIAGESEEASLSHDLRTDINSDSIVIIKDPPIKTNSMELVINGHQDGELVKPLSDKYTSPNDQSVVKSDTKTNNVYVVGNLLEEDPEDSIIYANQVTELQATAHFDKNYRIDQIAEETNARPADDVASPGVFEIDKVDEVVIYANQVCESEKIADTYCETKSRSKEPYLDNDSSVVVSVESGREDCSTTVIYANQFSEIEFIPQTIVETPPYITEEPQVPTVQNSCMEPDNTCPISPGLNPESRSFKETSFDEIPFTFSPVPSKLPSELREGVACGETDVDTLSDIDEIDIDILPDENYQKSKSVTDLDEALASFGSLDYLSNDVLDNISGSLSKSVPDILDSCRENNLRETVAIPSTEKLQKKTLSLSTPEITSKNKPGSKKVTKIKIVHVKFLEMQDDSGSENVEEDSFIYEGEVPISGKMKRRSRNLSPEFTSPVASPPPDLSKEISQEPWIAEKTNLKQLEFEFGDLFQNTPSPPPLELGHSSNNGPKHTTQTDTDICTDISKLQDTSMVYSVPGNPCEKVGQVSKTHVTSKPTLELQDSSLPDSSIERSSLTELNNQSFSSINASTTNSSRFEERNQRIVSTQSSSSIEMYYKSPTTASSSTRIGIEAKSDIQNPIEDIISALPLVTQSASSASTRQQTTSIIRSNMSSKTKVENFDTQESRLLTPDFTENPLKDRESRPMVENQNMQEIPSLTRNSSEIVSKKTDSRSKLEYKPMQDMPSLMPNFSESLSKKRDSRSMVGYENVQDSLSLTSNSSKGAKKTNSRSMFEYQPMQESPLLTLNSFENPSKKDSGPKVEYQNMQNSQLQTHNSSEILSTKTDLMSKFEYQNMQNSPSLTPHSSKSTPKKTDSRSYRYTPGNANSYSKLPKPVPEQEKFVVKYAVIATQSKTKQHNTKNITTHARYTESPNSSSPTSSPRHGVKLTEKFRMSEREEQPPCNHTDGPKSSKSAHRVSSGKATSRHGGRMVTVKGGIINDYECSSDADSEMSYNVPSPRVKAKRFYRPQVHRDTLDSASSSEPDSPRRGQTKDDRRSMSELFGVTDEQYSSDAIREGRESQLQSYSRDEKLFSRFGNLEQNEETATRHDMERNPPNIHQAKDTTFDQRPTEGRSYENYGREPPLTNLYQAKTTSFDQRTTEARSYNPRYTNALERNLSPTSFLQEGNLMSDDQMSPRTMEFNPFEDLEGRDGLQPYERCHSPSSDYSDTSSVFSFNCDFDPMPEPSGKFEPEVFTCENPMCRKQDILLGPEKTSFKSCPACFTYYCSSECRKLHWPAHKQNCYFGRVNTYVRSIIRLCQRREDLSMYLSQLARDGYKKKRRGVVMAIFNSPDLAREFITKGHDAFSGRKPTYSSLADLNREGIISKHRVALMQAVRDYEPNEEFVFNIAVVATNNVPIAPAPRYKLNTVLHCIKMPLNEMIVARQPKDFEKVETRLFALPKCSRHEFVNEMEARRHYCRNLSKNLRQYNIKLKEDYTECYRRLCMYVEHNISFEPMTVYGQRSGLSYRCVIAPEQSYPLNAEYC